MKKYLNLCKSKGFTLAEVLITLAIIGIIASLTIPVVISNVKSQQTVVKLKKAYAIMSQAVGLLSANEEMVSTIKSDANAMNNLTKYLNFAKVCGFSGNCWNNATLKTLSGIPIASSIDNSYWTGVLADGTLIAIYPHASQCDNSTYNYYCAEVFIGVNGVKNLTLGRDVFYFDMYKQKVVPFDDVCDPTDNSGDLEPSTGCTAKVLREGVINY